MVFSLLLVLAAGIGITASGLFSAPPVRITIVSTNDIHGALWPVRAFWRKEPDPPTVGGFSALAYYVRRIRDENENVLLLDAGDFFQGTPEGNLSLGEIPLLAMNHLGYDALTLGNHEFDFGVEPVASLSRRAAFPFLSANLDILDPARPPFFRDYVILERSGVKIRVVGVINPDLHASVEADLEDQLAVGDAAEAVRRVLEETAGKWDVSVVLSHSGLERDRELAAAVEGIDFILGGHSHSGMEEMETVNSARIGQTYGKATTAAVLSFDCRGGTVSGVDYRLIELEYDEERSDPAMELLLEYATAEIRDRMDVEIARSPGGLSRARAVESSPLGCFVADVILRSGEADFAFCNRAGIRADLPSGSVTRRDVFQVLPFQNTVVVMELSGEEVGGLIDHLFGWGGYGYDFSEGVLITVDPDAEPDAWVKGVLVGGRPLEPDRTYRVATNSFLIRAVARRRPADNPLRVEDTGINVREAVEEALAAAGEFAYSFRPRVVALEEEAAPEKAERRSDREEMKAGEKEPGYGREGGL